MSFYIPTYKECLSMIDNNPLMYFYERKYVIDSYRVSIFGYRYAQFNNFMLPVIETPNINALELKGISFVFDDNGEVFKHYLMLNKFWEMDQYEHCNKDKFINKEIKNVTTKEDGFLITFIMLPSGDIISQTKKGFDSEENLESNKYLDNKDYFDFISYCLNNDIQPIFELVDSSFYVKYDKQSLILTKLRCNNTGKYLNISDYNTNGIEVVEEYDYTLDELLEKKKEDKETEGWIVHFTDDTLLKIKTDWWINEKKKRYETV